LKKKRRNFVGRDSGRGGISKSKKKKRGAGGPPRRDLEGEGDRGMFRVFRGSKSLEVRRDSAVTAQKRANEERGIVRRGVEIDYEHDFRTCGIFRDLGPGNSGQRM